MSVVKGYRDPTGITGVTGLADDLDSEIGFDVMITLMFRQQVGLYQCGVVRQLL